MQMCGKSLVFAQLNAGSESPLLLVISTGWNQKLDRGWAHRLIGQSPLKKPRKALAMESQHQCPRIETSDSDCKVLEASSFIGCFLHPTPWLPKPLYG